MRIAVVIALVVAASTARAETVGVVVTGDAAMASEVASHLERWLIKHGHKLVPAPLSPDAINTMLNCLMIDDQQCARGVVEARSSADSLIFARVEVIASKDKATKANDVTFSASWFVKGHEAIAERRVCEHCTEDSWHGIVDAMMAALAGSSQTEIGRLELDSDPSGLIVLLDNTQIGVTPIKRDLAVGRHQVKLTHAGRTVARRSIDVRNRDTAEVMIRIESDASTPSQLGPPLLLGAGIAALGAGAILLYYGHLGGADQKYVYPDSTPIGIVAGGIGALATAGAVIWLVDRSHARSMPVAALAAHGGYVGWALRF